MFDWNDLRYFLALADHGSMVAAARHLNVSQTTVSRRIAVLEGEIDLPLFTRHQSGYVMTEAGERLLAHARQSQAGADAFWNTASEYNRAASGTVRITVEEIYAATILPSIVKDIREAYPDIRIDLDTTQLVRDLAAGEADIALRVCHSPDHPNLVGRRMFPEHFALYCSHDYRLARGAPNGTKDFDGHPIIAGGGGGIERGYDRWLTKMGLHRAVVMRSNSATDLLAAVKSGTGIAALPCLVADRDRALVRCSPPLMDDPAYFWLLTHERWRSTPRIRAVLDFLYQRLEELALESIPDCA